MTWPKWQTRLDARYAAFFGRITDSDIERERLHELAHAVPGAAGAILEQPVLAEVIR